MSSLKERLLARVTTDLEAIEVALQENLTPYLDLVSKTARHILFSGGKRLRPLLMVIAARVCNYSGNDDKRFAAIFEYLHAATLLHDDLIDGAPVRRGKPVAHSIFGNSTAVLVGDFLLARALSIAAVAENTRIIDTIAKVTEDMSQGEIQQMMNKGRMDITEKEYMQVIENKTAGLIKAACRVGALIADAPDKNIEHLSAYGYYVGIAFQMTDDLLDYLADTWDLGKEVGADLKEGKLTLPVIYALKQAETAERNRMIEIISESDFSVEDFQLLVDLLQSYGGLSYTRDRAAEYVRMAKEELTGFEPSEARETLEMIADYALLRKI